MARESIIVRLMSGPEDGREIVLKLPRGQEAAWSIGRSEDCAIALPYDPQVSRAHGRLLCTASDETLADGPEAQRASPLRLRLVDSGSRNGTYIGDRKLRNEAASLEPGELFRVGRTWLRVDP
jgi:pSer/pThr/pTyr-binding forkhead associated (FHA) protein